MNPDSPSSFTKEDSPQLQRGKACLSCRRRKMRCDGERPHCTQCIRGNRADDCEYTDVQGRTRTQILEESVALLQARIDELESPGRDRHSVFLHDPYLQYRMIGVGSQIHTAQTMGATPPPRPGSVPSVLSWWEVQEPPPEITTMLVDTFLPHAANLGFALSTTRFKQGLHLPTLHPARSHSALHHAIFLWAIRQSRDPDLMQHENLYLQRSVLALQDALAGRAIQDDVALSRQRVSAVQAEVLLARYFFNLGRLLEGRFHANAAVTIAVSCGFHRIKYGAEQQASSPLALTPGIGALSGLAGGSGMFELVPANDPVELGERIRLFWEVYVIEKCWCVVLSSPCVFANDTESGSQIDTPWPREMDEYEQVLQQLTTLSAYPNLIAFQLTSDSASAVFAGHGGTIREVMDAEPAAMQDYSRLSSLGRRAVAATFYAYSARLATTLRAAIVQSTVSSETQAEMKLLAKKITQFARGLKPVENLQTRDTSDIFAHALSHASMLSLHNARMLLGDGDGDLSVINSCLMHATEILKLLDKSASGTKEQLETIAVDPILSFIGTTAAEVFIRELHRMQQLPQDQTSNQAAQSRLRALNSNIDRILETFRQISQTSPIFAQHAGRIQDLLRRSE